MYLFQECMSLFTCVNKKYFLLLNYFRKLANHTSPSHWNMSVVTDFKVQLFNFLACELFISVVEC